MSNVPSTVRDIVMASYSAARTIAVSIWSMDQSSSKLKDIDPLLAEFLLAFLPGILAMSFKGCEHHTLRYSFEPGQYDCSAGDEFVEKARSLLPELLIPFTVKKDGIRFSPTHNGNGRGEVLIPICWNERDLRMPLPSMLVAHEVTS